MTLSTSTNKASSDNTSTNTNNPDIPPPKRIKSQDLFQQQREVEIEHQGKIYRLRMTQLNKLILTA